jgi:hypothetical protein
MAAAKFEIRKLTIGEILDEAFKVYRHGFWRFLLFQLVIYGPSITVFALVINMGGNSLIDLLDTSELPALSSLLIPLSLAVAALLFIHGVVGPISSVALCSGVADTYLSKPWSIGSIARDALGKAARAISVGAVYFLIVIAGYTLPILFFAGGTFLLLGGNIAEIGVAGLAILVLATVVGGCLAIVVGTYVNLRFSIALTAVALEDAEFSRAFSRSSELLKKGYGQGLGLFLILVAFNVLGGVMIGAFVPSPSFEGLDAEALKALIPPLIRSQIISSIGSQVIGMLVGTYAAIAWTLYYFSQRCEKEGFDLSYLADRLARGE